MPLPTLQLQDRLPHLSTAELKQMDSDMVQNYHVSTLQLMECAGLRLADFVHHIMFNGCLINKKILICCGKGHNGGDGLIAARHLAINGAAVTVITSIPPDSYQHLPQQHLYAIQAINTISIVPFDPNTFKSHSQHADLLVDALLGFGLTTPPRPELATFIQTINSDFVGPLVSLDIPSGMNTDTGECYSPTISPTATLSLAALKTGFKPAKKALGTLFLADIGVPPALYQSLSFSGPLPVFTISPIIQVY